MYADTKFACEVIAITIVSVAMEIRTKMKPYLPDFSPGVIPGRKMKKTKRFTAMVPAKIPVGVPSHVPRFTRAAFPIWTPSAVNMGEVLKEVTHHPFSAIQMKRLKAIIIMVTKPMTPCRILLCQT